MDYPLVMSLCCRILDLNCLETTKRSPVSLLIAIDLVRVWRDVQPLFLTVLSPNSWYWMKCVLGLVLLPTGLHEAQAAGIKFTHRLKIGFSPRRGDSLHRFMWNLAWPTGTWVDPLGCAKFHLNRCRGPQNIKNFHFLVMDSPPIGKSLDRFLTVLGDFMRTIILQKCFKCDVIRFTGYGVIAENRASVI